MDLAPPAEERQRHHGGSGWNLLLAARAVFGELPGELVAEHDLMIGAHVPVIARLRQHVG